MKQIKLCLLLVILFTDQVGLLEAAQIPTGQDVGATVHGDSSEKEQKAMLKRIFRKKKKVQIEGQEAIQPKPPAGNL